MLASPVTRCLLFTEHTSVFDTLVLAAAGAALPPRVRPASRWLRMSSSDQEVSTGGTGTGVQTIVKEVVKELTVVRLACRS